MKSGSPPSLRALGAVLVIGSLLVAGTASVGGIAGVERVAGVDGADRVERVDDGVASSAIGAGTAADGPDTTAAVDGDTIHLRNDLFATDDAGVVGVTTRARIPDRVTELRITLLNTNAEPVEADGFEPAADSGSDEAVWEWDGETAEPSLTYAMDANVTVPEEGPLSAGGSYRFVDAGDWALVRTPRTAASWSYTGQYSGQVRIERENAVPGEGVASRTMAFLGPYEEHVREGDGQRYRLIVPEAAELVATPEEVFEVFEGASTALQVGARDDEVVAFAAPTGEVSWSVRGLQTGEADLWVRDEEPAGTAADVWTHEYVHTRQAYRTESDARWITEASATYYAALFALDRGAADFDEFERTLARGEREPDASAVLADPATWDGNPDYTKGALVAGELDRRLRLATDGRASLATVLRDLNDAAGPVTNRDVLDAVEAAAAEGGDDEAAAEIRAEAERLITTRAGAETWDRDAHADAFGETPAQVGYELADDGVRATGEYRERPVAGAPVELVRGETLALSVAVSNTGGVAGAYDVSMTVDGEAVDTRTGTIDAGTETVERFEHAFASPGTYEVRVGSETLSVVVSEPAPVLVRDVTTDLDSVAAGDSVRVTATVANDATVPAGSDVVFRVDGETVGTEQVRLDAGEETTVERTVTLGGSSGDGGTGDVVVSVAGPDGEASTTVNVAGDGILGGEGPGTDDAVPGFGPVAAVVAVLAAVAVLGRRGRAD